MEKTHNPNMNQIISDFNLSGVPRLIFGSGRIKELPSIASYLGKKLLLLTGKASFSESEVGKLLIQELGNQGFSTTLFRVENEPSPADVDAIASSNFDSKPDVVIAIGGGSVIDAGKAVSAMLTTGGNVSDFLEGVGNKNHPGTKIPFIAIPTTSGTGSEATKNAVLSFTGRNGYKRSLRHDNFVPDIALVDPQLTINCPQSVTSASGMDSYTQLLEAFVSVKANIFTDTLAKDGIRLVNKSLLNCYKNGSDLEARTDMSYAAFLSGICLANAGLGAVHGFASSIGGLYNIPHGVVCGTLMAVTNRIIARKLRHTDPANVTLLKYASLGSIIEENANHSRDYYVDSFLNQLEKLTTDLNLPGLEKFGVLRSDFESICNDTDMKNNPVKLSTGELLEILEYRF